MSGWTQTLRRIAVLLAIAALGVTLIAACGDDDDDSGGNGAAASGKTFYIGGIPDQDVSVLEERFNKLAEYLSDKTGLHVEYLPSVDYAAVVTGFKNGDIQMGWFGGLTGVQARLAVDGAQAVVQRETDETFHSVFVAGKNTGITSLADLKGHSFTFGSESSTSGNLMPRYYLKEEAGINPEDDFSTVNYSGSHDTTWKLVESGSFDAGALNASVWKQRVDAGEVDLSKVDVFYTTPAYYDYHFVVRPDLDKEYGEGTTQKIVDALLAIDPANGGIEADIVKAFEGSKFIATKNENYDAIEAIGRDLGVIE
jgi:phosphonate transport system substrate-binding protein